MADINKQINYLNKNFSDFKESLQSYLKTYFPNSYNDFSDASPGSMFLELSAYVGDVLSFYFDRQIQENLLEYAKDKENLMSLAYSLGYRPKATGTSIVSLDIYQLIPGIISGGIATPDYNYTLILDKESAVGSVSNSDITFITQDLVDFSYSSSIDPTIITVYQINGITNQPDYYLFKKKVKAYAGQIKTTSYTFGVADRFSTITISDDNIIGVLDIVDSEGNRWFEVPYLAQNTIFEEVRNQQVFEPNYYQFNNVVPYILRLKKVQRRFVSRFTDTATLQLEFGSGTTSQADEEIIPNSDNVGMGLIDSISKLSYAYDPSNFMYTRDYGIAPANTTLTIRYLVGGGLVSNVPSNDLTQPINLNLKTGALSVSGLNQNLLNTIKQSIGFNNTQPASGGGDGDGIEEIRLKALASFGTQLRGVTKEDYAIRTLSLPSKFGTIAKVYVSQDYEVQSQDTLNANPLAISLYILSYDQNKNLTNASSALKENLKRYLSMYRMVTDAINIKDAYYINISVNFDISVLPAYSSREVLADCLAKMTGYFNIDRWSINQPILLSELYKTLNDVKGVQNVSKINIVNKYGVSAGYSPYGYDISAATKNNVIYGSIDPSVFEVRFPSQDIYGRVVNN